VKIGFKIIFWIMSVVFFLLSLTLLISSLLSCVLMLTCAVLINPQFLERIHLKKKATAFLVIGLFLAAFIVMPQTEIEEAAAIETDQTIQSIDNSAQLTDAYRLVEISSDIQTDFFGTSDSSETGSNAIVSEQTNQDSKLYNGSEDLNSTTTTETPKTTPTPTARPTVTPTQTPETSRSNITGIEIIDYTDVIGRGEYASIKIKGTPNTYYDCDVEYKSGMSTAQGLEEKKSDSNGYVTWRWKVGTRTSTDYIPTIYISGGGDSISVKFRVIE